MLASLRSVLLAAFLLTGSVADPAVKQGPAPGTQPRKPDGRGSVKFEGEMMQWHKVTLTLDGPYAHELDNEPNPFTDYRINVSFRHESGSPDYRVPGYFAADGDAGNSSADSGTTWRAHLSPDKPGKWSYRVSAVKGKNAALDPDMAGGRLGRVGGKKGSFKNAPPQKAGAAVWGK